MGPAGATGPRGVNSPLRQLRSAGKPIGAGVMTFVTSPECDAATEQVVSGGCVGESPGLYLNTGTIEGLHYVCFYHNTTAAPLNIFADSFCMPKN